MKTSVTVGNSFGSLLCLIFVVAKLWGVIDWSWWWVFAPIWIPIAITLLIMFFCLCMALMTGQIWRRR